MAHTSTPLTSLYLLTVLFSFTACASLDQTQSAQQAREISATKRVLVANKNTIRSEIDGSGGKGALVFTDNKAKTVKRVLVGNSPMDAWIRHVSATNKGAVTTLPLPSSISPTAAYIYSGNEIGQNVLIMAAEFDQDVSRYYDLSRTMTRLGSHVQELRDITILISMSDKKQNESVTSLKQSFESLSENISSLSSEFQSLQNMQETTRNEIMQTLSDLDAEMQKIKTLIEQM
ncbi:hypothetical protein GHK39_30660 [Sinorhizobium medicae]|uniref:hypothetical protein n=1 Tax=Sinorhizobium medicae TaxID=110321 RepID=UPI001296DF0B|nr:hypothetical protein [Sinorhizobium medicae]MQV88840.1 hypothetical protein [Sinorhizobium medicae]MQV95091.1 hypothetical protein [Sinorhizobium medicae]WQO86410.1 hypothetical protein U8C37_03195 [Sinorhizobium medicae]